MLETIKVIAKGAWIGGTMSVPGVSGGTMAVVVGIYERLIHALNGLLREPKKHVLFLLEFVFGAALGFLVLARGITFLLENQGTGEATRFFFCGVVAGGIPLLVKKSGVKEVKPKDVICLISGAAAVFALAMLPEGLFSSGSGIFYILLQAAGGFLVAVALVLPGISATHMLYILGLYEAVLEDIYTFQLLRLIPLAAGGVLGTFLSADLLERWMERHTRTVYLIIIGFVAGSMASLAPEGGIAHPVIGIFVFAAGFFFMYQMSKRA